MLDVGIDTSAAKRIDGKLDSLVRLAGSDDLLEVAKLGTGGNRVVNQLRNDTKHNISSLNEYINKEISDKKEDSINRGCLPILHRSDDILGWSFIGCSASMVTRIFAFWTRQCELR